MLHGQTARRGGPAPAYSLYPGAAAPCFQQRRASQVQTAAHTWLLHVPPSTHAGGVAVASAVGRRDEWPCP